MITYILALLLMLPTPALPLAPPLALKTLLSSNTCHLMPCVYDGLSASLVARSHHHFNVTFQTGFGVASVAGYPDAGILQRAENNNAAFTVAEALANTALSHNRSPIPCIADGDTGHGSAMNIRRTIHQYGRAQMAGVMIEDQVSPKRCGHVDGKEVVAFEEAVRRIKIACDARDEYELLYNTPGPLILARTDARGVADGTLEDAIRRCQAFIDAGADLTFLEAPQTVAEMEEYCERVPGPKLYNSLEGGKTPILPLPQLEQMGFNLAAYPLTLLSASTKAMEDALDKIASGEGVEESDIVPFEHLKEVVGFTSNNDLENKYFVPRGGATTLQLKMNC